MNLRFKGVPRAGQHYWGCFNQQRCTQLDVHSYPGHEGNRRKKRENITCTSNTLLLSKLNQTFMTFNVVVQIRVTVKGSYGYICSSLIIRVSRDTVYKFAFMRIVIQTSKCSSSMKLNSCSRAACFVLHSTDTSIYVMRGPEILLHFSRPNRYSVWRLTPGSLTPESGLLFSACLHEFL